MRSSNPVLRSLSDAKNVKTQAQPGSPFGGYGQPQAGGYPGAGSPNGGFTAGNDPYGNYYQGGAAQAGERPMTIDDVVTKTGTALALLVVVAAINFGLSAVSPGLTILLTIVGAIGGLITVFVAGFGNKYGSAAVTLTYAVFEGLFVGGFSVLMTNTFSVGGADAGVLIGQAILGTVGVFIGMLYVYKSGAVKVTPKFNRILTGVMIGILVAALGNLITSLLFGINVLTDGGPLAIIFSLICIVVAALSFLSDFEVADSLIRAGAPAKNAWGVALGLCVTLVWLYTEILRLLSYFRNN